MAITRKYDSGVCYTAAPGSAADRRAWWDLEADAIYAHAWGVDLITEQESAENKCLAKD